MDLDLTEEQDLLRETARRICETTFGSDRVRALECERDKFNREFWAALSESGLCGLNIAEDDGGAGMGALDLAVVCEEFGRALASSPFVPACLHASGILSDWGEARHWLPRIASGDAVVIPICHGTEPGLAMDGATLSGCASLVAFASVADAFLVRAGETWALVDARSDGIEVIEQPNYASQALFTVRFDAVHVSASKASGDAAVRAETDVLIAMAAEAVGAASGLLALTVDYANQRRQFGKPIAAFQAISHPLVECATELEGARYLAYQAAWARDEGRNAAHLARMAKFSATTLYRRLAKHAVQVHGGIGYSSEGAPQLYYRRSKHLVLMHGAPHEMVAAVADRVLA